MAVTSYTYPVSAQTGNPASGSVAWTDPNNIKLNDGNNALALAVSITISEVLRGYNFGFSFSGVTIDGIEARYERSGVSCTTRIERLYNSSGNLVGTNKSDSASWGSLTTRTIGGASDLWGASWSESSIESSNFGLGIQVDLFGSGGFPPSPGSGAVDYLQIRVYYTLSAPTAPSGCTIDSIEVGSAMISWTDNASNETGFTLQKQTDGGGYSTIATLAANVESYEDTVIAQGHTYQYRVRADRTGASSSAYSTSSESSEVSGDTPTTPARSRGIVMI